MLILCGVLFYGAVVALDPWAIHMGGRWTPLLIWQGSGKLVTKTGVAYPLYVSFYPSAHSSQLHMDGLRPTGGLQGDGWLCTSRGVTQRLLEPKVIDMGQRQGYFDLYGKWHGPELVMNDRDRVGGTFGSGLRIEHASVTLDWGTHSDFEAACASAANLPTHP